MAALARDHDVSELMFEELDDGALVLSVKPGWLLSGAAAPGRFIVNRGGGYRFDAPKPWWIYVWETVGDNRSHGRWMPRIDMTQHQTDEELKTAMLNAARLHMDTGVFDLES